MNYSILKLSKFISKGATRICFEHPKDKSLCVKVVSRFKDEYILQKELNIYNQIKYVLKEYLVEYKDKLVDTNFGKGVVCEVLRDDNNEYSKTLSFYKEALDDEVINQLWHFAYKLIEYDIFFYDFNLNNFIIQIKQGKKKLYYTDIKSFNHYKPYVYLRIERFIPFIARHIMIRRLKRFFYNIGIDSLKS